MHYLLIIFVGLALWGTLVGLLLFKDINQDYLKAYIRIPDEEEE